MDSVFSHRAFAEQLGGLPFELIADFERKMVEAYGVRREDVPGYSGMPQRSVFVVDPQGVIRWTWQRSQDEPLPGYSRIFIYDPFGNRLELIEPLPARTSQA